MRDILMVVRRGAFGGISDERGSSVLETALLLPVLLLLLAGAVDFGRGYYVAIEVNSAAHAAALYGAQNFTDIAGMEQVASQNTQDIPGLVTTAAYGCECYDGSSPIPSCKTAPASCPGPGGAGPGSTNLGNVVYYVQVNTAATYTPVLSYPGLPASLSINGQARMRAAY